MKQPHEYIAKTPFQSRQGQFETDKRTLCIGLDLTTLHKYPGEWWIYLGKKGGTHFEVDQKWALTTGQQWVNPQGKVVIIVPIGLCRMVKADFTVIPRYVFDKERGVYVEEIEPKQGKLV